MQNWTKQEVLDIYHRPLMDLIFEAAKVHRQHHDPNEVQVSSLISIKTGGCPEDCAYCPQAARYHTDIEDHSLMSLDKVKFMAQNAKSNGASRVCMGAAWRNVEDGPEFDQVLEMVRELNQMEMEVCCTLGMITERQAERLARAGLYAYNHNLDTSEEYYDDIISTRSFDDRLKTIENVRKTNVTVCSGGIIGMGESVEDRVDMLLALAKLSPQPESVPINALVPVEGTPLGEQEIVPIWEVVRMIATTRIVLPTSVVRLSAGRTQMSMEGQALCFLAGAGSIFAGDKLLTTPNPDFNQDKFLFETLGINPTKPYKKGGRPTVAEDLPPTDEKSDWTRPKHRIERNVQATKAGVKKRREEKEKL